MPLLQLHEYAAFPLSLIRSSPAPVAANSRALPLLLSTDSREDIDGMAADL
jgi:hypothetical protein